MSGLAVVVGVVLVVLMEVGVGVALGLPVLVLAKVVRSSAPPARAQTSIVVSESGGPAGPVMVGGIAAVLSTLRKPVVPVTTRCGLSVRVARREG